MANSVNPPAPRSGSVAPNSARKSERPTRRPPKLRVARRPLPPGAVFVPRSTAPRALASPHARLRALLGLFGAVLAAFLFWSALGEPWWKFKLYAPQHPHGLTLVIGLTGLSGDVHEIDMLNHYIGMGHLDAAAVFERRYAAYAVALLCAVVVGVSLFAGRKLGRLLVLVALLFPLGFVADCFYWLHRFGHALDRRAPLHIPPFTPQLFGNGTIGQFMTFALPERGFWLACTGVFLLALAAVTRGGESLPRAFRPLREKPDAARSFERSLAQDDSLRRRGRG